MSNSHPKSLRLFALDSSLQTLPSKYSNSSPNPIPNSYKSLPHSDHIFRSCTGSYYAMLGEHFRVFDDTAVSVCDFGSEGCLDLLIHVFLAGELIHSSLRAHMHFTTTGEALNQDTTEEFYYTGKDNIIKPDDAIAVALLLACSHRVLSLKYVRRGIWSPGREKSEDILQE